MIIYKDYITFSVMKTKVNLITIPNSDTDYMSNFVIAEVGNKYYYLGYRPVDVDTAIFAWEQSCDKKLTDEEICQIKTNNK